MKKGIVVFLWTLLLFLSGCALVAGQLNRLPLPEPGPTSFTVDEVSYQGGFYSTLFPHDPPLEDSPVSIDGVNWYPVEECRWDLYYAPSLFEAVCAQDQWDEAAAFYADFSSFSCFCEVGVETEESCPILFPIDHMDQARLDDLLSFARDNSYDPFSSPFSTEDPVETIRIPIPTEEEAPTLVFYRQSPDGLFVSDRSYRFRLLDGALLLVYFYDYGHGAYEELAAVPVPEALSDYFVGLLPDISPQN